MRNLRGFGSDFHVFFAASDRMYFSESGFHRIYMTGTGGPRSGVRLILFSAMCIPRINRTGGNSMDELKTRPSVANSEGKFGEETAQKHDRDLSPMEIEEKSFRILEGLLGDFEAPPAVREVIKRIAHATTDVEWAKTFRFSPGAVEAGIEAIRRSAPIVTDVEMVRAGIRGSASAPRDFPRCESSDATSPPETPASQNGSEVLCFLNDPDVVEAAKRSRTTRSRLAMRKALPRLDGAIIAIGNAPTALFEVCDLIRRGACHPALVVGVPIGFVGAAEAHEELASLDCDWITVSGPKGGSPVAAAAVNAIIRLAGRIGPTAAPNQGGRRGFTTGSCAAAAAKGAATLLVTGDSPASVEIPLPSEDAAQESAVLCIPVEKCERSSTEARCAVRKDSGDDPDTTNGMLIVAEVSLSVEPGVTISGGPGIGRITRKGLPVPPGEWAINPVPLRMIREALAPLIPPGKGFSVAISAPEGEERAAKTWNPRLGIEGGISILGTTGIVEPKSTAAYLASIDTYISAALAFDSPRPGTIFLVPGYVGERTLAERYAVPRELIVPTGDHFGYALKKSIELGARCLHLFGHIGKWAKVAAGIFNTHCDYGDARLETIAACAGACDASSEQIRTLLALPLAEEAVPLLERWGLSKTFDMLAERMHCRCALHAGSRQPLVSSCLTSADKASIPPVGGVVFGVAVLSLQGDILGSYPSITAEGHPKEAVSWEDLPSSV